MLSPISRSPLSLLNERGISLGDYPKLAVETTDDGRFGRALTDAENKSGLLLLPVTPLKLNNSISIDIMKVSIVGIRTKLDFSGLAASSTAVTVTASQANNTLSTQSIGGLEISGASGDATRTGLAFSGSNSSDAVNNLRMFDLAVHDFSIGYSIQNNAYILDFYNCSAYSCGKCLDVPSGDNNYGERITFIGGTFANSTNAVTCDAVDADIHLIGVSLDYCGSMAKLTGGRVFMTDCHLESDQDTDYWLSATGNGVTIRVVNSQIYVKGNKTAYEVGYTDPSVNFGGIEIENCSISIATYTLNNLIKGTGRASVHNLTPYLNDKQVAIGDCVNAIAHGGFEDSDSLSVWTGVSNVALDTTQHHSGTQSAKFSVPASGDSAIMEINVPMTAGQRSVARYWLLAPTAPSSFYIVYSYLDSAGNTLQSGTFNMTTAQAAWAEFTGMAGNGVAPAGTTQFQLAFNTGAWNTGVSVWVDDVVINVI